MSFSKSVSKLAPLTGPAGILGVIIGLALDNFPDGSFDDAQVAQWFAVHGTTRWIVSGACIALGGALLLVFAAVLADRVQRVPDHSAPVAAQLVRTAGPAWAVLTMVGGAFWLGAPIGVEMFDAKPTAALMQMAGPAYAILVTVCAFAAAALAAALATVARSTELLPRWLTLLGYPAAVLMLTNVLLPMAVITLWYVAVSVSLLRRTASTRAVSTAAELSAA